MTDEGTLALTLTVAEVLDDMIALGAIISSSTIAISDTAANVAANINALNRDSHVTSIALADGGTLTLTVAQALDNAIALGEITTPYTITISDTAANVAANIDALNGDSHITSIALTDVGTPVLTLTAAQALDDTSALDEITTPYTIAISDKAADVADDIDALSGDSLVTSIASTDGGTPALTLTVAQALDDTSALGEITTPYTITISDTAADVAANIDALNADGLITSIGLTDGETSTLTLTVAQALDDTKALGEITTPYTITVSGSAANVAANINQLNADAKVTSILLTDPSAPLTISAAEALNDTKALVEITGPHKITVSDTAAHLESLTASNTAKLAASGVSELFSDNANVVFKASQTNALIAGAISVDAASSYTATENLARGGYLVYKDGKLIRQKTVGADGSYDIATNVTGKPYSSLEDIYNSSGAEVAQVRYDIDGTGSLTLQGGDLTVSFSSTADSVKTGPDTFALSAHANESIAATGSTGDTFVFTPNFGTDTISGFDAAGSGHDVLSFTAASFSYLTSGMSHAQELAAVLSHATQSGSGNTTIFDSLGDTLTLKDVSKSTLAAAASDFRFV